jgi:hypothetical protein
MTFSDAPAKISKQGCAYESGCLRDKSQKAFFYLDKIGD